MKCGHKTTVWSYMKSLLLLLTLAVILAFCPSRAGSHGCDAIQHCLSDCTGWAKGELPPPANTVIASGALGERLKLLAASRLPSTQGVMV